MITKYLKQKNTVIIGIDVGNSDIKSANTSLPNGFIPTSAVPKMCNTYLSYNGMYYVTTPNRFRYLQDKTSSDNCFISTIMSIGCEIIQYFTKKHPEMSKIQIQELISQIKKIEFGCGLPPAHMGLSEKYKKYYLDHFGKQTDFIYDGYEFHFSVSSCYVFPQDFSATYRNGKCAKLREYGKYFALDIGGYTADLIAFVNGEIDISLCFSKELGILKMYSNIISRIQMEHGITLDNNVIENVLEGKKTVLSAEIINTIISCVKDHCSLILNTFRELGIEFKAYPCVFIGGGSLLLKPYIKKSPIIGVTDFINDVSANASGYERIIEDLLSA